ncbi:hypothetical protein FQR65_LT06891 [Abscondita terminalis]|nr:hypothetical protein FQR65_LT06891 [Abscondita terminalis]
MLQDDWHNVTVNPQSRSLGRRKYSESKAGEDGEAGVPEHYRVMKIRFTAAKEVLMEFEYLSVNEGDHIPK